MKKWIFLIGTILLSTLIIGMPYYLLKSSLMHDCNEQFSCTQTIQHKLSKEISIHPNFQDSNIVKKLSTDRPYSR